jgi:hypothetical protein
MAKKPIPGMQETALSSLANQFPGSGGRGGSDAAGGGGAGPNPTSPAEAPPARVSTVYVRKGASGWILALAVLICLAAATVSLSAPSLRPVVRDLFVDYAPEVPRRYVDFLVGQSRASVEIDLTALDSRIEGLRGAINAVADGAATDSVEMKQFLTGALTFGTARRLEENFARLESDVNAFREQGEASSADAGEKRAALAAQLTTLEGAVADARNRLEAGFAEAKETDVALDGRLAVTESQAVTSGAMLTAIEERLRVAEDAAAPVAGRFDSLEAKIATQEEGLSARIAAQEEGLSARIAAQEEGLSARITAQEEGAAARVAAQAAVIEDLKSAVDTLTQAGIERVEPLLMILRLNNAIAANRSYKAPLDAAAEALAAASGDATAETAIATLRRHEGDSIPTRDQITRDFTTISQSVMISQEPSRIESLRDSIVTLLEAALDKPTPAVSDQDQMKSMLRSIQAELSGGRLVEALEKAESLDHPKFRTKFNAWRAQVRARLEVDAAVEALEVMAFKYLSAQR